MRHQCSCRGCRWLPAPQVVGDQHQIAVVLYLDADGARAVAAAGGRRLAGEVGRPDARHRAACHRTEGAGRMSPAGQEERMTLDKKRLDYVSGRLKALGERRVQQALMVGAEGGPDPVSGALLIAVGIRESGLRNVLGDHGSARGSHQFHDAYHAVFLRSVPGCKAAPTIAEHTDECWREKPGRNALQPGYCPRWIDSCRYCVTILNGLFEQAQESGVRPGDCLSVAVAAYNCGFTRALLGYEDGNHEDEYTTGGNYAFDVLARRTEVNHLLAKAGVL